MDLTTIREIMFPDPHDNGFQWRDGCQRQVSIEDFVTGNHQNVLRNGDLLRQIDLPAVALGKRAAFRQSSLTHLGRSAALLVGTLCPRDGTFMPTVTAATSRPLRFSFSGVPVVNELRSSLERQIPDSLWFDDVHGSWDYKKHLAFHYEEGDPAGVGRKASS